MRTAALTLMKHRQRVLLFALFLLTAVLSAVWLTMDSADPLFRGKPESYWLDHLSYRDDEQVERWRDFGSEGVQVLIRALDRGNRPADRLYRQTYRYLGGKMPALVMDRLPAPRTQLPRSTRMKVVDVLSRLSKDATEATPVMTRTLRDEDHSVRQIAITFFTAGEDESCLLNQMEPGAKRDLLPEFIRAMQDANPGVRNNAVIALRFYREEAPIVAPVLVKALQDPVPRIRKLAAETLKKIDPKLALKVGARSNESSPDQMELE